MKTCTVLLLPSFLGYFSVLGMPNPIPTVVAPTTTELPEVVGETNATTPIWLRFLKNKKVSPTHAATTELPPPVKLIPTKRPKPLGKIKGPILVSNPISTEARRSVPSGISGNPPTNSLDEVLDKLTEYFHITPAPNGYLSGDAIAQDRQANPDTLYDQMYLDWIRKREAEDIPQQITPMPEVETMPPQDAPANTPAVAPPVAPYNYPAVPLAYSPFFPALAGFKMQKAMVQAQMDSALAAIGFTTTPKPLKLKLKIQVPGLTDMTQLAQITSTLTANLPPGSTFELA